jgi:hypothetical protein
LTLSARRSFLFWYLGTLFLPFILVILAYQLALLLLPGTVKMEHWEVMAAALFMMSIVSTLTVVVRSKLSGLARIGLGGLTVLLLLEAALTMTVHSTCQERPTYIGTKPTLVVASCS